MPFIGNTGKIDQIYLARLDPQQVEDQQAANLDNIRTGDIEASNVLTSNIGINVLDPTHNFDSVRICSWTTRSHRMNSSWT